MKKTKFYFDPPRRRNAGVYLKCRGPLQEPSGAPNARPRCSSWATAYFFQPMCERCARKTPLHWFESARARNCLQKAHLSTAGEVAARSEYELLGCEALGRTTLKAIKGWLGALGLSLRDEKAAR